MALALAAPAPAAVDVPRSASLVLEGEHRGDAAGASVARAGDVNGDGRSDIIIGAPLADPLGRQDAGAAYVVFGGGRRGRLRLGSLGKRGFRIAGAVAAPPGTYHPGERHGAGVVVAGAGDINGDGLADVLVSGAGAVNVVFGKRDTAPVDLAALGDRGYPILSDGDFGTVVAGRPAGDVNGDALADVAVTVDVDSDEDAGSLWVAFGTADTAPQRVSVFEQVPWGFRIRGGLGGMYVGAGAAPAGDRNGDGLGDLLVGAPGTPDHRGRYGRGAVFVVYGTRDTGGIGVRPPEPFGGLPPGRFSGHMIRGPRGSGGFGSAVARFGRGFVAGAPGSTLDYPLRGPGSAWIVPDRRAAPIHLAGPRRGGPAGVAVDAPGDVAGGPGRDVLVMARGRRLGPAAGRLFSSRGRRITTYRGLRNGRFTRASAAGAGDFGGSRRNDLVFGSPGADAAYVLMSRRPRGETSGRTGGDPLLRHAQAWSIGSVLPAAAALAPVAGTSADTTLATGLPPTVKVSMRGTAVAWSAPVPAGGFKLVIRTGGVVRDAAVAPSPQPFDVDLGDDGHGHLIATYSRCRNWREATTPRGCDVYAYAVTAARERRVAGLGRGAASDYLPTAAHGRIAFARSVRGGQPRLYVRALDGGRLRALPFGRRQVGSGPTSLDLGARGLAIAWKRTADYGSHQVRYDKLWGGSKVLATYAGGALAGTDVVGVSATRTGVLWGTEGVGESIGVSRLYLARWNWSAKSRDPGIQLASVSGVSLTEAVALSCEMGDFGPTNCSVVLLGTP